MPLCFNTKYFLIDALGNLSPQQIKTKFMLSVSRNLKSKNFQQGVRLLKSVLKTQNYYNTCFFIPEKILIKLIA